MRVVKPADLKLDTILGVIGDSWDEQRITDYLIELGNYYCFPVALFISNDDSDILKFVKEFEHEIYNFFR